MVIRQQTLLPFSRGWVDEGRVVGGCDILKSPPIPTSLFFFFFFFFFFSLLFFFLSFFFFFFSFFFFLSFSLFFLPFHVLIIYHLQIDKSLLLVFSTLTCPIPTGRVLYRVCQGMRSMPCFGGSCDKTSVLYKAFQVSFLLRCPHQICAIFRRAFCVVFRRVLRGV